MTTIDLHVRLRVWRPLTTAWLLLLLCATFLSAESTSKPLPKEFTELINRVVLTVPGGGLRADDVFDLEVFTQRTLQHFRGQKPPPEAARKLSRDAIDKAFEQLRSSRLNLLRAREEKGELRATVRVMLQNGSLDYIEFIAQPRAARSIRFLDYSTLSSGELMSETFASILQTIGPKPGLLQRLISKDHGETRALAMQEIMTLEKEGKHRQLLDKFETLPLEVQRLKPILIRRMRAAGQVGEKEFLAAIRFWRVNHSQDPSLDFLCIDGFEKYGRFDEALQCVDRLDAAVGGDYALDYIRSAIHQSAGHKEEAQVLQARAKAVDQQRAEQGQQARAEDRAQMENLAQAARVESPAHLVPASVRLAARSNAALRATAPGRKTDLKLQGLFLRTGQPSAIISGQNVGIGDFVNGNKVTRIEASRVTLEDARGEAFSLTYQ